MKVDKNKKFVMLTVKELADYSKRGLEWTKKYGNRVGASGWAADPDNGSLDQRVAGQFDWAVKEIAKFKLDPKGGNVESLQPEFEFGLLDGTEVDMDQYMIHNPRCLGRVIHSTPPNGERVINLALCVGMSGATPAAELARNSAAVLAVAKKYDDAGYEVKLHVVCPLLTCGDIRLVIVDCSQSSIGQVISMSCSALVFRTLMFDAMEEQINTSPNKAQAISHLQNSGYLQKVKAEIKRCVGVDTKVIFTGSSESQVMEEISK